MNTLENIMVYIVKRKYLNNYFKGNDIPLNIRSLYRHKNIEDLIEPTHKNYNVHIVNAFIHCAINKGTELSLIKYQYERNTLDFDNMSFEDNLILFHNNQNS